MNTFIKIIFPRQSCIYYDKIGLLLLNYGCCGKGERRSFCLYRRNLQIKYCTRCRRDLETDVQGFKLLKVLQKKRYVYCFLCSFCIDFTDRPIIISCGATVIPMIVHGCVCKTINNLCSMSMKNEVELLLLLFLLMAFKCAHLMRYIDALVIFFLF